jgi:DNA-binding transcriptional ArsR family regulator
VGKADKRDETSRIVKALNHELRRQIVCYLAQASEPKSPAQTSKEWKVDIATVGYHYRTLADYEVVELSDIKPARGAVEHFYKLTEKALKHPLLQVVLTEEGIVLSD